MWQRISSVHNDRIRIAARLRDRRGRKQQRRIIIDGRREVIRALQAGLQPLELFVHEAHVSIPAITAIAEMLDPRVLRPALVAPAVFEKVAFGDRSEGIVLVAAAPQRRLVDLQLPTNPLVCVLERVEKPGNLGAVVRTADACGAAAVMVADGSTDIYNPNAIRASLGTIFLVPVVTDSSVAIRDYLQAAGCAIFAARVDGAVDYSHADYRGSCALIFGSEAEGLSDTWSGQAVTGVSLPMLGAADSLNVSVAAAVLCYEALRQRRSS
jgi:RNA methyltransferase, TrmH family